MPTEPSNQLDHFLRRLRRRAWTARVAEAGGAGLAIAAAGSLVMVGLVYGHHQSAQIIEEGVAAMLACGLAVGAMAGLARRPGMRQVAGEADRQLQLPELLGSAALLPPARATDPQDRALRLMLAERAAAHCGRDSGRRIRLRKWGTPAWTAVTLGAAVPILLATLTSPRNMPSPAGGEANSPAALARANADNMPLVQIADSQAARRIEMNPDEHVHGGPHSGDSIQSPATSPPDAGNPNDPGPHSGQSTPGDNSSHAAGAGNAHTHVDQSPAALTPEMPTIMPGSSNGAGAIAGGAGSGAMNQPGHDAGDAGGLGRMIGAGGDAPWSSPGWAADAEAARQQLAAGRIPTAYRDLVRAYFSPDRSE